MEKRPIAYRHLARMHEMVTHASFARVAVDRGLSDDPAVEQAGDADRAIDEEIQTLARDRGWTLPETTDYAWKLVQDDENSVLPRLLRVVARDLFELDEMRRHTDDEEVAALASTLYSERHALQVSLEAEHPEYTLPGAK